MTRLLDALPAGSYLVLSHPSAEVHPKAMIEYTRLWNEHLTLPITTRSRPQLTRFFDPLELLEPGVVPCSLWRPDPHQIGNPIAVDAFCGVGRKPGRDVVRVSPAPIDHLQAALRFGIRAPRSQVPGMRREEQRPGQRVS